MSPSGFAFEPLEFTAGQADVDLPGETTVPLVPGLFVRYILPFLL